MMRKTRPPTSVATSAAHASAGFDPPLPIKPQTSGIAPEQHRQRHAYANPSPANTPVASAYAALPAKQHRRHRRADRRKRGRLASAGRERPVQSGTHGNRRAEVGRGQQHGVPRFTTGHDVRVPCHERDQHAEHHAQHRERLHGTLPSALQAHTYARMERPAASPARIP